MKSISGVNEAGLAISFICANPANEVHFRLIEKRHNIKIAREQITGFIPSEDKLALAQTARASDPNDGIKGKRPNKKDKLRAQMTK